jgi:microcystin-dependent protein
MSELFRHTPILTGDKAVRLIVADTALLPFIGEVLDYLTHVEQWVEVGDTVEDIQFSAYDTLDAFYAMQLVGMVQTFLILPPPGWLLLDGATYDEVDYPELHSQLPNQLKTVDDFTLPDMSGSFSAYTDIEGEIGDQAGENVSNLTIGQLPEHSHTYTPPVMTINAETPTTPVPTAGIGSPTATGTTGDGDDIENRPLHTLLVYAVYAGRE